MSNGLHLSELVRSGLDVRLNGVTASAKGGVSTNGENWQMALLYAILQELQHLNRTLGCSRFQDIPTTLLNIETNTQQPPPVTKRRRLLDQ